MAPIGDAAHGLHAARPVRRALVRRRILVLLGEPVAVPPVEALLEASPHRVPVLAQRVPRDALLRRDLDVVRQCEPVVVPGGGMSRADGGDVGDLLLVSVLQGC